VLLVTDRAACRGDLTDAVTCALAGGVTAVMLREKDLATRELVSAGRGIAAACRAAGRLLVVNHDLAAAAELGAEGVHLGYRSAAVREARAALGDEVLVGRSTHDAEELARALDEGADYVTFGPVYDTPSKRGLLTPRGARALADAVDTAGGAPVVALGGVTAAHAAALRATGAAGVACIREILAAADPEGAARALATAWGAGS
jgi:thiamine-phosphate pyrophosphorylase